MEEEDFIETLSSLNKTLEDLQGFDEAYFGGGENKRISVSQMKDTIHVMEGENALRNSRKYNKSTDSLPQANSLRKVDVLDIQKIGSEFKNIGFKESDMFQGYNPETGEIYVNKDSFLQDDKGRLFFISTGMTHQKQIGEKNYAVIETVLNPFKVFAYHELGHAMFYGHRETPNLIHKPDVVKRYENLIEDTDIEDFFNIQGGGWLSENRVLSDMGLPLRYGYISGEGLYGGKRIYEPFSSILNMEGTLSGLINDAIKRGGSVAGVSVGQVERLGEDKLRDLPRDESPLNPKRVDVLRNKLSVLGDIFGSFNEEGKAALKENFRQELPSTRNALKKKVEDFVSRKPQKKAEDFLWGLE